MAALVPRERGFVGRAASPEVFLDLAAEGLRVAEAFDVDVFLDAVFVADALAGPAFAVALRAPAARWAAADAVADVVGLASGVRCSPVATSGSGEAGCNALIAP